MMIADGQIHIWGPTTPDYPWDGDSWKNHLPTPFEEDEIIKRMDEADVDRAILVPPKWDRRGNDVGLRAAKRFPKRLAVMARLLSIDPKSADLFPTWRQQPGMLGFRFSFTHNLKKQLSDGTADWIWPAAERAGLPLMILPPGSLGIMDQIAERHPGLKIIIDHMALVTVGAKNDDAFDEFPDLIKLARRPNVAVKASALPCYSTEPYPYRGLHKYIKGVYDAFGPRRVFWGSDLTRLPCSYRQLITLFTEELPWLSPEDKEWIMGRGLCEWIGWPAD